MKKRVLIAEDDHQYQSLLVNFFNNNNYETIPVSNGDSVIGLFIESSFDLAIINFNLPGKKGDEIMRIVNRELIETPIIIITEDDSLEKERFIRSYGPAYLFIKPFSMDNMEKVIVRIFSKENAKYI